MAGPCGDHGHGLALRRKLMLLLQLLDLLRFVAAVILDRLGVVSYHDELLLPAQPCVEHVDTDAMERLMEAAFWAPTEPPTTKRQATARKCSGARVAPTPEEKGAEDVGGESAAVCAICLAGLQEAGGCQVTEMCNCSHAFHTTCIDGWVASGEASTCPLCRTPVSPTALWDGWPEAVLRPSWLPMVQVD